VFKQLKNEGIASITEVIVTSVIFVIAAAGILSSVSMLRPQRQGSPRKLEAVYYGKGVIDELRTSVDAATWNTGPLRTGVDFIRANGNFTANYSLTDVPNGCTLGVDCVARKMIMVVDY